MQYAPASFEDAELMLSVTDEDGNYPIRDRADEIFRATGCRSWRLAVRQACDEYRAAHAERS